MKRFDAFLEFTCERSRMDLRKIRIFDIEPLELPDPSVKQRWRWRNTRGDAPFHSYIGEGCDDSIYVFRPDCVWSVFVYLGFFFLTGLDALFLVVSGLEGPWFVRTRSNELVTVYTIKYNIHCEVSLIVLIVLHVLLW